MKNEFNKTKSVSFRFLSSFVTYGHFKVYIVKSDAFFSNEIGLRMDPNDFFSRTTIKDMP